MGKLSYAAITSLDGYVVDAEGSFAWAAPDAEVHGFVVPTSWPPGADTEQRLGAYLAQHGQVKMQAALTTGQHDFPDGLFYGILALSVLNVAVAVFWSPAHT